MTNTIPFVSKSARLADAIAEHVKLARAQQPLQLPGVEAQIVSRYVEQIEGSYDTKRAKTDTDHAIELLYIAYNTTPQVQGQIRNAISAIMSKLIDAQQASQVTITDAVTVAAAIDKRLRNDLPQWLDIKDSEDTQEIKAFIAKDLLELAKFIETKALDIKDKLLIIAKDYDVIITETEAVTQNSESLLSETLEANAKLAAEMRASKARSEALEALVDDMRKQVEQFQKLADDYQNQAQSAEQKSSWGALLQGLLEVVSVVMPIVALVSGVGAPLVAASVAGSVSQRVASSQETATAIGMREDQSRLQVEQKALQETLEGQRKNVQSLQDEQAQATGQSEEEASGLQARIGKAQEALNETLAKSAKVEDSMAELQNALGQLEKHAGTVSEQQASKAKGLRQLQLEMVSKAEAYETKRSEHGAELTSLKVLLAGQRDEQETNELAIRSLNLSMAALKRTKEIVEEVAHFFLSFSSFMQRVSDDANAQVESYEQVAQSETLRRHKREQVFASTDAFFIEQTAQWLAVAKVCEVFAQTFADGWSKLNALNGTYISGEQLDDYLVGAATKLGEIMQAREAMKAQRLIDLDNYRKQIESTAEQA
ncbi:MULTISPECIES: hypothetical protein [unclassified Pseudomonas]|uniref:hypothetical protein n=1 Tax=unclassified Pseudomonas TaxID=196821 RepID=UPI00257EDB35|nr:MULTISPECIES: hypothetical protein [unclassified Pseudomonas]